MARDILEKVAAIVRDAGGRVVGRTKLQKIAYILEEAGVGEGFNFEYYHYGPYSEDLASLTRDAVIMGVISEKEQYASWGGSYSTYEIDQHDKAVPSNERTAIAQAAAKANSVELELAATALYLAKEGYSNPWEETARRKPEKSDNDRLSGAKALYDVLSAFETPKRLPHL